MIILQISKHALFHASKTFLNLILYQKLIELCHLVILFVIILVLAFKFRILIASGALDFPTTLIVIYICIKPIATS